MRSRANLGFIKLIVVFLTLIVITAIIGIVVIIVSNKNKNSNENTNTNVCQTNSCVKYARFLKSLMNESINPCESFYDFTCGKFINESVLKEYETMFTIDNIIGERIFSSLESSISNPIDSNDDKTSKMVKNLYKSCTNTSFLSSTYIKNIIDQELGGWPILTNKENILTSIELLTRISKYDAIGLISINVAPDPKNTSIKRIKISQPDFYSKEYLDNPESEFVIEFKNYLNTSLSYLNGTYKYNESDINDIFILTKNISMFQMNDTEGKNTTYKNITIKTLQNELFKFPWKEFILEGVVNSSNLNINEDETVIVNDWDYISKVVDMFDLYSKTKKKVLDNYLIFKFFDKYVETLPIKFLEAKAKFDKVVSGVSNLPNRSKYCIDLITLKLPIAIGKLFVEKNFDSGSKAKAIEMSNYILKEFKQILNEADWMDSQSKQAAIDKANAVKFSIGYPDNIYNKTYLGSLYMPDADPNQLTKNFLELSKYLVKKRYTDFKIPIDKDEWENSPSEINAFYYPEKNHIFIPAGILQYPYYDSSLPNYVNFGTTGSVIGHELTHGFDNQGRLYDKDGTYFSDSETGLWSNKTIVQFKNKSECMINQYNNYIVKQVNKSINGEQTLGENIADNGGIKEAFRAYQNWVLNNQEEKLLPEIKYNQNQLFFISLAAQWCTKIRNEALNQKILEDVHAVAEMRVKGMTSNYEKFSKAFDCKPSDANNPLKKCSLW